MIPEECLDLFLDPDGFTRVCGTKDYQIIRMCEGKIDIFVKIARDGKFFLITEDPVDALLAGSFPYLMRYPEVLKLSLYFLGNLIVLERMPVRYKSIIRSRKR